MVPRGACRHTAHLLPGAVSVQTAMTDAVTARGSYCFRVVQMQGFLLSHNRPLLSSGASKEDQAQGQAWWAGALQWDRGVGYRAGVSALDAPHFCFALASCFTKSALAAAESGPSSTLKAGEEGLVHATLEQAAWASFKVHTGLLLLSPLTAVMMLRRQYP